MPRKKLSKCSFCLQNKGEFLSFNEVIFGSELTNILVQLSGLKISELNKSDALICQECTISIVQANVVKDKLIKTLNKLSKSKNIIHVEKNASMCPTSTTDDNHEHNISLLKIKKEIVNDSDGNTESYDNGYGNVTANGNGTQLDDTQHNASVTRQQAKRKRQKSVGSAIKKTPNNKKGKLVNVSQDLASETLQNSALIDIIPSKAADVTTNRSCSSLERFQCVLCDDFTSNYATHYKKHLQNDHNIKNPYIFKCDICLRTFATNTTLRRHMSSNHGSEQNGERTSSDDLSTRANANAHVQEHEDANEQSVSPEIEDHVMEPEAVNEEMSDQELSQSDNIRKICNNCGSSFKNTSKYDSHVFNEKCKNAIYECQDINCSRLFTKQSKMIAHMKKKHTFDGKKNENAAVRL